MCRPRDLIPTRPGTAFISIYLTLTGTGSRRNYLDSDDLLLLLGVLGMCRNGVESPCLC